MSRKYKSSLNFGYVHRKKKSKLKFTIIILLIIMGILGIIIFKNGGFENTKGLILKENSKPKKENKENSVKKSEEKVEVKEIVENEFVLERDYKPLKKDLEKYLKKQNGVWGIYFYNINGKEDFGIKENDEFQAASTIKIPINLLLYEKVAEGKEKLETKVLYEIGDKEGGTGRVQYSPIGKKYTLRKLSKLALIESDNTAINMISKHLGRAKVYKQFMKDKGAKWVDLKRNVTSPKDLGIFLNAIYQFDKDNPKLGKEILSDMKKSVPTDRIQKLLPKEIEVAHKVGNYYESYHDVGIIFARDPYILCIMSKDAKGIEENFDIIAEISKKVYDYAIELEKLDDIEKEKKDIEDKKKNKKIN
ncbi:MAG: serine hydrolase [Clostridiales bacterium]